LAGPITLRGSTSVVERRSPLAVALLHLVPLYGIFWYYLINQEMVELGRVTNHPDELGENAGMSVIAVVLGGIIIIPPFVSFYRTMKRIESAQNVTMGSNNFSPVLCFVLLILVITSPIAIYLMQSNLNQAWETQG
jgi:hypothetical protein